MANSQQQRYQGHLERIVRPISHNSGTSVVVIFSIYRIALLRVFAVREKKNLFAISESLCCWNAK